MMKPCLALMWISTAVMLIAPVSLSCAAALPIVLAPASGEKAYAIAAETFAELSLIHI